MSCKYPILQSDLHLMITNIYYAQYFSADVYCPSVKLVHKTQYSAKYRKYTFMLCIWLRSGKTVDFCTFWWVKGTLNIGWK